MPKFADYTEDTTPADGDLILTKDVSATATKKVTLLNLIKALVSFVSSFTAAGTLDGTELVPISQGGAARKVTVAELIRIPASVNAQTGTTYTLQASDNGKVITCSNASAITVTVPSGLGAGFNCMVIQKGAGQVTFSPSSTTINNRQSHTKTAGQHAAASLVADVANNFYLGGDTAS